MSVTAGDGSLWGYFLFIGLQSGKRLVCLHEESAIVGIDSLNILR